MEENPKPAVVWSNLILHLGIAAAITAGWITGHLTTEAAVPVLLGIIGVDFARTKFNA